MGDQYLASAGGWELAGITIGATIGATVAGMGAASYLGLTAAGYASMGAVAFWSQTALVGAGAGVINYVIFVGGANLTAQISGADDPNNPTWEGAAWSAVSGAVMGVLCQGAVIGLCRAFPVLNTPISLRFGSPKVLSTAGVDAAEMGAPGNPSAVHRLYEQGKPKFQLRSGEDGLSVFDGDVVVPEDILPHFRQGTLITTQQRQLIESAGLKIVQTPGDENLPPILQNNHWEIRPGDQMIENPGSPPIRTQFKAALKVLEKLVTGNGG